ncbi:MAG: MotA/TolQ/ExbB proton channel family protein [Negativicutes bacterium]|nr:MotA/TolQ/ExbB proton channel family protein [Negativicutes bacterium]
MELISYIYSLFSRGGLVMWPLLLCSVIVVAIVLERGIYFRNVKTDVKALFIVLDEQLKTGDLEKVRESCENVKGVPAEILAKALTYQFDDSLQLEKIFDGLATMAVSDLKYRLDYLETIVTLAPLLGLLGTVTGMIQSFSVLTIKSGQPLAITGGIGEALIATATGLCIAILALIVHSYFSHRVNSIISDIERVTNVVLSTIPWRKPYAAQ